VAEPFDTVDAAVLDAFGESITYTPDGGGPTNITGFFQNPDVTVDGGDGFRFEANGPQVAVKKTDVPTPGHGDTVTIGGTVYTVRTPEDDEGNVVILQLQEQ